MFSDSAVGELPSHGKHLYDSWIGKGTATGLYLANSQLTQYGTAPRGWDVQAGNEINPAGQNVGDSSKHNNIPPYSTAYIFVRTT